MQGTYGSRRIDYTQLTFGEQFSSQGFDVTIPTGENGLTNLKLYLSIRTGLLNAGAWYRYNDAFYPYVGLLLRSIQLGITYDIITSKQNQQLTIPRSFEM